MPLSAMSPRSSRAATLFSCVVENMRACTRMDTRRRTTTVTHWRRSTRTKEGGRGEEGVGEESVGDGDCEKRRETERRDTITRGALPDVNGCMQAQAGGQGEELKAGVALFEKRLRRLKGVMASRFGLDPEQLQHVCQEDDAPVPKPSLTLPFSPFPTGSIPLNSAQSLTISPSLLGRWLWT